MIERYTKKTAVLTDRQGGSLLFWLIFWIRNDLDKLTGRAVEVVTKFFDILERYGRRFAANNAINVSGGQIHTLTEPIFTLIIFSE